MNQEHFLKQLRGTLTLAEGFWKRNSCDGAEEQPFSPGTRHMDNLLLNHDFLKTKPPVVDCVIHHKEKLVTLDYTQLQLKQEERSLNHPQSGWQSSELCVDPGMRGTLGLLHWVDWSFLRRICLFSSSPPKEAQGRLKYGKVCSELASSLVG